MNLDAKGRLERINDRWGNYDTTSTKGMTEMCLDFEWLLERVEELQDENESLKARLETGNPHQERPNGTCGEGRSSDASGPSR